MKLYNEVSFLFDIVTIKSCWIITKPLLEQKMLTNFWHLEIFPSSSVVLFNVFFEYLSYNSYSVSIKTIRSIKHIESQVTQRDWTCSETCDMNSNVKPVSSTVLAFPQFN